MLWTIDFYNCEFIFLLHIDEKLLKKYGENFT